MKQEFATGKAPKIVLSSVKGALTLKAHDEPKLLVNGWQVTVTPTEETGADGLSTPVWQVQAAGPVTLYVPLLAQVVAQEIAGAAVVKGVQGHVTLGQVAGSVSARNVGGLQVTLLRGQLGVRDVNGAVEVGQVTGDMTVRNVASLQLEQIQGDLVVQNVHGRVLINHSQGDVVLRNIGDSVTINYCDRDLSLRNVAGVVQAHHVHGDIRLREGLPPGEHLLKADGDIVLRWPVTVALALQASGRTIENQLPLRHKAGEGEALRQEEHGRVYLSGRMGDGNCQLTLESQADIILKPLSGTGGHNDDEYEFEMDFGFGLGQMMEQFGEQMAGFGETIVSEINNRLTSLSQELETGGSKQNEQVAQKVERALRKTEEALRKMQQQRPASYAPPPPPPPMPPRPGTPAAPAAPPPPAPSPATTDDRAAVQMKILEMLQNGQIDVEQANLLLKALE